MKRKAFAVLALAALLTGVFAVSALGRGDQAATSANVNMTGAPPNFSFRGVPTDVRAGTVRFTVRNTSTGQVQHNFTVFRNAGSRWVRTFASRTLAAGGRQSFSRRLTAGTYIAVCTVNNGFHAAHRMVSAFQVQ
jgi:plastocyanin